MSIAFLLDVDNTLLDNDRFNADLDARVRALVGAERTARFHALYEEVRDERGYVDFPETLRRFAATFPDEARYAELAAFVLGVDFAPYVFDGVGEVLARLDALGMTAILSDGDMVFQAAKIGRSGLARLVGGRVFIYAHKEMELAEVRRRFPADRYVLVDDKPAILVRASAAEPAIVTVFVRQGKYAREDPDFRADLVVDHIGDLARVDAEAFRARTR